MALLSSSIDPKSSALRVGPTAIRRSLNAPRSAFCRLFRVREVRLEFDPREIAAKNSLEPLRLPSKEKEVSFQDPIAS